MKKLTCVCGLIAMVVLLNRNVQASPYSLNTTDLSVTASHNATSAYKVNDGDYTFNSGWDTTTSNSLLIISFVGGAKLVDKIEFGNTYNGAYSAVRTFELFYTIDANPTLSSTLYELTGLSAINTSAIITGNYIHIESRNNDLLIAFDATVATSIVYRHIDSFWGTQQGAMINEITIDEAGPIQAVPEPASLVLVGLSLVGLVRQITKL